MSFRFLKVGIVCAALALAAAVAVAKMPSGPLVAKQTIYHPVLFQYAEPPSQQLNTTEFQILPGVINVPYRQAENIPTPLPPPIVQVPAANYDGAPPVIQMTEPKQTVMLGDYAASALQWMLPLLAPIIAAFLVDVLIKVRQRLGISTSDAQRDKLQQMAENAVNLSSHKLGQDLTGKLPVQVKSQVMAQAVDYVQAHGADTIKALGLDPTDPKTVEALQGRIATILADKEAAAVAPAGIGPVNIKTST